MEYKDEAERDHNKQGSRSWETVFIIGFLFKGARLWVALLVLATVFGWVLNILGTSTRFNDPDIYYSGRDPKTGQLVVTKGCRPAQVLPDGSCDNGITWDLVRKSFPNFESATPVPGQAP